MKLKIGYTHEDIIAAIKAVTGNNVRIQCNGNNYVITHQDGSALTSAEQANIKAAMTNNVREV